MSAALAMTLFNATMLLMRRARMWHSNSNSSSSSNALLHTYTAWPLLLHIHRLLLLLLHVQRLLLLLTVSAERAPLLQPAGVWLLLARHQAGDGVLQLAANIPAGTTRNS
jgi:hypothetical protein